MPFTLSHVAAVLPLCWPGRPVRSTGQRAPFFAMPPRPLLPQLPLVIGSMMPDLPMYVGMYELREVTHQPVSAVGLDIAVTAVLAGLWVWVIRPAVGDLVPAVAARWGRARIEAAGSTRLPVAPSSGVLLRLRPALLSRLREVVLWYFAAIIGVVSHLVLDAPTHSDGLLVQRFSFLTGDVAGLKGYYALQIGSSVLGLAVLAWWGRRWWVRSTPAAGISTSGGPLYAALRVDRWQVKWIVFGLLAALALAVLIAVPQSVGRMGRWRWKMQLGSTLIIAGELVGATTIALVSAHWLDRARRKILTRRGAVR